MGAEWYMGAVNRAWCHQIVPADQEGSQWSQQAQAHNEWAWCSSSSVPWAIPAHCPLINGSWQASTNKIDIRETWALHLYIIAIYYCHQRSDREFLKRDLHWPGTRVWHEIWNSRAVDKFDFSRPCQAGEYMATRCHLRSSIWYSRPVPGESFQSPGPITAEI